MMFARTAAWLNKKTRWVISLESLARESMDTDERKRTKLSRTKAAQHAPSADMRSLVSQKVQTADYIAKMAAEMAQMSNAVGLSLLAHLLKLAQSQAEVESKTARHE